MNWDTFEGLPGATESNFEALCRALIRRHYARYGVFRALAAQPGVEFHLKLQTRCPTLGEPGRWYGWQCRWYDLPGGRAIGPGRREKIRKAIATTEKVLPDLTDWILWTRRPLTSSDQAWFYGLKTQMRLQMWTSSEVEEHLSGDAEILRSTYFGELVLTPDALADEVLEWLLRCFHARVLSRLADVSHFRSVSNFDRAMLIGKTVASPSGVVNREPMRREGSSRAVQDRSLRRSEP